MLKTTPFQCVYSRNTVSLRHVLVLCSRKRIENQLMQVEVVLNE